MALEIYTENLQSRYIENSHSRYTENSYSRYIENSDSRYTENLHSRYIENSYSRYIENLHARYIHTENLLTRNTENLQARYSDNSHLSKVHIYLHHLRTKVSSHTWVQEMIRIKKVVYKYTCGALYFGQTRRHLYTRISEHMGVSPLTYFELGSYIHFKIAL